MNLTKTQKELLNNLKSTIEVFKKYSNYEDMFYNSDYEQNQITTSFSCGYRKKEDFSKETWEHLEKFFNDVKYNNTLLVTAKTETINALVKHGDLIIIEPAMHKGCSELVKVIL